MPLEVEHRGSSPRLCARSPNGIVIALVNNMPDPSSLSGEVTVTVD